MEIYLIDLNAEKQKEVLKFLNAEETDNFDLTPLFILENGVEA